MADAIKDKLSLVPNPQSCSTWCKSFKVLSDVVRKCPCPGMRDVTSYLPLWTIRVLLLRRMYAAGATRLKLDGTSWNLFAGTFPDQKKMLQKVVQADPGLTCKMAMQRCNYTGPPELMTMHLCFLSTIDRTRTHFLTKNKDILAKARADYKEENHQNPVLRELVKIIKEAAQQASKS